MPEPVDLFWISPSPPRHSDREELVLNSGLGIWKGPQRPYELSQVHDVTKDKDPRDGAPEFPYVTSRKIQVGASVFSIDSYVPKSPCDLLPPKKIFHFTKAKAKAKSDDDDRR